MTRKDYILIADVLKECFNMSLVKDIYYQDKIIQVFCRMLKSDNSSFDYDKFINYVTSERYHIKIDGVK